ncbi:putative mitochondrial protein, partial [Mucuna pruriens]
MGHRDLTRRKEINRLQMVKNKSDRTIHPTNKGRYQRLVGRLIYLPHTRPDIAYVVGVVIRFMHNPSEFHMEVVFTTLHYLKSRPRKGLMISKHNHATVSWYCDFDWGAKGERQQSTTRYFTFVGGNLVTWKSKRQKKLNIGLWSKEYKSYYGRKDS